MTNPTPLRKPEFTPKTQNLIINGNFDHWQRNTYVQDVGYVADRFRGSTIGLTTANIRQSRSGDVPYGDGYSWNIECLATHSPT